MSTVGWVRGMGGMWWWGLSLRGGGWGGGSSLGAVIIGCVVYGIQLGWGVRGLWVSMFNVFGVVVLLLNTIINPYYHSCVFMTDIYLTISLSIHNRDDTPQNILERPVMLIK
jgi:hypothetical protein